MRAPDAAVLSVRKPHTPTQRWKAGPDLQPRPNHCRPMIASLSKCRCRVFIWAFFEHCRTELRKQLLTDEDVAFTPLLQNLEDSGFQSR